jgi:hypothetical protein
LGNYSTKNYHEQGGDRWVVGGVLDASAAESVLLPGGAVSFAASKQFVSTEQTGTGSSQDVAHGLGAVPAAVLIVPTDTSPSTVGTYTATEGAHDSTNVKVTVTSGKKFKVWAMA